ncbi:hypothetical protein PR048_019647 [Dryococelus australis]|uniref:DDE-1 domain-containing protein n=1 Tax=Dryococelus australis TaxID=614101 RepID=A0ABQ9H431_9NEOP|nr:hypothetical protein PR048_019647 [Dryococelus australis]
MTCDLLTQWLKAFNAHVGTCNQKVILFVDNCPAHLTVELRNTELVFLPPDTTSFLQPMDQGNIQLGKKKFCDILVNDMVVPIDINQPWRKLDSSQNTSPTFFQYARFVIVDKLEQIPAKIVDHPDDPDSLPAEDGNVTA